MDFESLGGEYIAAEIFDLFNAAIWERVQLSQSYDDFSDTANTPAPTKTLYDWSDVYALRLFGCRDLGGSGRDGFWLKVPGDYEGAPMLQGTHKTFSEATLVRFEAFELQYSYVTNSVAITREWRGFPEAGTTRKFPREIYDLTQPGSDGDVARLVACLNRPWFGPAKTEPGFNTFATTPADQRDNSGLHFVRSSGEWIQTDASPDIRQEIIPGDTKAYPFSSYGGDYFGGHWLNDTRDMINQLTCAAIAVNRKAGSSVGGYETDIDGLAVVRVDEEWRIQVDMKVPPGRNYKIEFWVNPLSDTIIYDGPSYRYYPYTSFQKIGEQTAANSGRYQQPIPSSIEVFDISSRLGYLGESGIFAQGMLAPLVYIVIRGDHAGGLVYR